MPLREMDIVEHDAIETCPSAPSFPSAALVAAACRRPQAARRRPEAPEEDQAEVGEEQGGHPPRLRRPLAVPALS